MCDILLQPFKCGILCFILYLVFILRNSVFLKFTWNLVSFVHFQKRNFGLRKNTIVSA